MSEDVEPSAMCHPQEHLTGAVPAGDPEDLGQHREHHIEPLDREALLPQVGSVEEALQALDPHQTSEEPAGPVRGQRLSVSSRFDVIDQPIPLGGVLHLIQLVADAPAIDLLEPVEDVRGAVSQMLELKRGGRDVGELLALHAMEVRREQRVAGRR